MTAETPTVYVPGQEPQEVVIIDLGEGFNPDERGSIPNHDKVEIVYKDSE